MRKLIRKTKDKPIVYEVFLHKNFNTTFPNEIFIVLY